MIGIVAIDMTRAAVILAAPALIYACDIKVEVIFHFHLLELGNEPKHQGASTSSTTP